MAPEVGGSIPLIHPIRTSQLSWDYAPVAQLDRAPDFESVGRRFESCRVYLEDADALGWQGANIADADNSSGAELMD